MKKLILLYTCIISMSCLQYLNANGIEFSRPAGHCHCSPGPMGPAGPTGPAGINGDNGVNGNNGTNGTNGSNGIDGNNGSDGATGNNFNTYMSRYSTSIDTLEGEFNTINFDTPILNNNIIYNPGNNSFTLAPGIYSISLSFLSENPIWVGYPDVLVVYDNTHSNQLLEITSGIPVTFEYSTTEYVSIDVRLPSGTTPPVTLRTLSIYSEKTYSALIEIHQIAPPPSTPG